LDPLPTFVEPGFSPISKPEIAKEYPLIGAAGLKLGIHTHSQFRTLPWIREIEPDPFAEIHPRTAAEYGLEDDAWIYVKSPEGSIKVRARIRQTVRPGVIAIAWGYGEPYAGDEDLTNMITSDEAREPITGATGNRSFLCKVERVEG
jgi:anaerobic selenocysteine-containing dehydrogenase